MAASRRILFLMGPASLLWRDLAQAFEAAGHEVFKINFSLGDQVFWWRKGATPYRGRRANFQTFLEAFIEKNRITDILYYGDRDFYHVIAQQVAAKQGLAAISLENGYLRPDWITLERGGMGIHSHFPDDPATIRQLASRVPAPDLTVAYTHGFMHEITLEICYSMVTYFWRLLYPFYRFGRIYDPLLEYILAIPHMFGRARRQKAANALINTLVEQKPPCFAVALQLQGDQQIRANSPYTHLAEFIDQVTGSFAAHAGREDVLVFKQHPHDNNREGWRGVVQAAARRHGVENRVRFIDGGDLGKFLATAKGCVVVNSTVGLFSLRLGCPTKTMGVAIYDMPGLTHQGSLDEFWQSPAPVDLDLLQDFVRALSGTIQVKGSFFNPAGRQQATREIVRRIVGGLVNEPGAFITPPPRLATARARGLAPRS